MLFGNWKKWSINMCHNTGKVSKHYAKWKMSDTKMHVFYDPIYVQCPEMSKLYREKVD